MPRVHSHYENLKVPRDASPEAIRAAWRRLAQRHHPDRRPGDAEAVRIMQLVNAAYDTLSDPTRRAEHDAWIRTREAELAAAARSAWSRARPRWSGFGGGFAHAAAGGSGFRASFAVHFDTAGLRAHLQRFLWLYVALAVFCGLLAGGRPPNAGAAVTSWPAAPALASADARLFGEAAPVSPYVRPATDPRGQPWPDHAAALRGFAWLSADGHGEIELSSPNRGGDWHVALFRLDDGPAQPVRQVYLPAGGRFTLTALSPGRYGVWQRELATGDVSQGAVIEMPEAVVDGRIQARRVRVALAPPSGPRHALF